MMQLEIFTNGLSGPAALGLAVTVATIITVYINRMRNED